VNPQSIKRKNLRTVPDGRSTRILRIYGEHPAQIAKAATVTDCLANGYAPRGYKLADFTIVRHAGAFHLFHIPRVGDNSPLHPANEHWLGHAVSRDLDTWTTLNPALCVEPNNYYEDAHVWAPFVLREGETHYMFYTGLTGEPSQVLCVATCREDGLMKWQRHPGNPITPLEGFDWHLKNEHGHARNARDPHVVKTDDHYLLAYTAMHENGCPAVGGMISKDLLRWEDIGPIHFRPIGPAPWLEESVTIQPLSGGRWALIPSQSPGLEYYISDDPHHWHGIEPTPIEYDKSLEAQGVERNALAVGLEVLSDPRADRWLVAFFGFAQRLVIGELDLSRDPWKLTRISDMSRLEPWLERL